MKPNCATRQLDSHLESFIRAEYNDLSQFGTESECLRLMAKPPNADEPCWNLIGLLALVFVICVGVALARLEAPSNAANPRAIMPPTAVPPASIYRANGAQPEMLQPLIEAVGDAGSAPARL